MPYHAIHNAAKHGNLEKVRYLVQEDPYCLWDKSEYGSTALLLACYGGHYSVVEFLLRYDTSLLEQTNEIGYTAIHFASQNGHLHIVQFLLQLDPSLVSSNSNKVGSTPLHSASYSGHLNVVQYLLQIEPKSIHIPNKDGWTALHRACRNGRLEVTTFLLRKEPNLIHVVDKYGNTPLDLARQDGHIHVVKFLEAFEKTIKKDDTNNNDISNNNNTKTTATINNEIVWDSSINSKLELEPIHTFCMQGNLNAVKKLVHANSEILLRPDNKSNNNLSIHYACEYGQFDVIQYIAPIYPKELLSAKNQNNHTPLEVTILHGHFNVVEYLLRYLIVGIDNDNYLGINDMQRLINLAQTKSMASIATLLQEYFSPMLHNLVVFYPCRVNIDTKLRQLDMTTNQIEQVKTLDEWEIWNDLKNEKKLLVRLCKFDKYQTIQELETCIHNLNTVMEPFSMHAKRPLLAEKERYKHQLLREQRELERLQQQEQENDMTTCTETSSSFAWMMAIKPRRADEAIEEFMSPPPPFR